jgi:hypothetical protein
LPYQLQQCRFNNQNIGTHFPVLCPLVLNSSVVRQGVLQNSLNVGIDVTGEAFPVGRG